MIAGEFDLSIGSMVGFAGIVIGIGVTSSALPVWLAIVVSLVLTTLLGVANGLIVVRTGLPSFIVTLATLFIIRGFTVATDGRDHEHHLHPDRARCASTSDPIAWIFNWSGGASGEFKVSIIWWLVIAAIGAYVLAKTRFGNWIAGVGGSASAARNLGVPVARVKITLFAVDRLLGRHPRGDPRA